MIGSRAVLALAVLLGPGPACAADAGRGAAIAAGAGPQGVPACSGCHGDAGAGGGAIPRLAGLPAGYIEAQLRAFKAGTRANDVMGPIARQLDEGAMADLAAAYAALRPPAAAAPPAPVDATLVARGESLALRGDWSEGLPPCASCHGRRGLGVGAAFPPLAGQHAAYLAAQLAAWKNGARRDDPLALMRTVAARLDDGAVAAVAAYYASLPAAPPLREATP